jgi:hypothetical protein
MKEAAYFWVTGLWGLFLAVSGYRMQGAIPGGDLNPRMADVALNAEFYLIGGSLIVLLSVAAALAVGKLGQIAGSLHIIGCRVGPQIVLPDVPAGDGE